MTKKKITMENTDHSYSEQNCAVGGSLPPSQIFSFEHEAETFAEYKQQVIIEYEDYWMLIG